MPDIYLGTVLQVEIVANSGVYTTIPDVVSVKPPAAKAVEVKTPYLTQPSRVNPRQPGTLEPGDLEFTQYRSYDWWYRYLSWSYAGDTKNFKVFYPDGTGHGFQGYLDEPEVEDGENDKPITMKVMVHATSGTTAISA